MGVWRWGFFLSIMVASPPSTFFSCAFKNDVPAANPKPMKNVRRDEDRFSGLFVVSGFDLFQEKV